MKTLVIGASGAIGSEIAKLYGTHSNVYGMSRSHPTEGAYQSLHDWQGMDFADPNSIDKAISNWRDIRFDRIWIATGMLHTNDLMPEKKLEELNLRNLEVLFLNNTFGPALCLKACLEHGTISPSAKIACLSARVGSIEDNRLGGWYSYRASKAALNMIIKTASIELQRKHKQALLIGCHPGTVDSKLSMPFQKNVPEGKLFNPSQSAGYLVDVLEVRQPSDSGKIFDWQGIEIPY